jgi:nucleotide-binding universal stress UspA family protein
MTTKILLPLKFSAGDGNALGMALKMAKRFESCLHILHVLNYKLHSPSLTDAQVAQFCQDAEKKFQEKYQPLFGDFSDFSFACCSGDPAMETAKFARQINAEVIIVGCHTRGDRPAISRLGETTLSLLQWAPCSVMMVPCDVAPLDLEVDKLESLPIVP